MNTNPRQLQLLDEVRLRQSVTVEQLAETLGVSASVITRDLDNLRTAGLAERDDATGHWRLTPRLPQQAIKVFAAIDAAARRVDEARNRYTRNPD